MTDHSLLLEDSPGGWMQARLDDICRRVQDAASPSANGQRLYLGLEHLASGLPTLVGRGKESDVRSGKTTFRKDDFLFGKLRPYLRKSVLVSEDGICSTDILRFRAAEKCIPEFLCFLTHTDEFVGHAKATTSGVQHPRTSWAALREFRLSVPPLPEQRKIAGVLGVVQRAIEQQERLLQLTAALKKTLPHPLWGNRINHEGVPRVSPETAARLERHRLEAGDILFARRGEIGRHGMVTKDEEGWLCGTGCFLARVRQKHIDNRFFSYLCSTPGVIAWLNSHAAGAIMPNLNNAVLGSMPVFYPKMDIQSAIAD